MIIVKQSETIFTLAKAIFKKKIAILEVTLLQENHNNAYTFSPHTISSSVLWRDKNIKANAVQR
jgi:hypothetical protein